MTVISHYRAYEIGMFKNQRKYIDQKIQCFGVEYNYINFTCEAGMIYIFMGMNHS